MWMRQMTLDRIDLVQNEFHEAPDSFMKSHTRERRRELKAWAPQETPFHTITHCCETLLSPYFTYFITVTCFFFSFFYKHERETTNLTVNVPNLLNWSFPVNGRSPSPLGWRMWLCSARSSRVSGVASEWICCMHAACSPRARDTKEHRINSSKQKTEARVCSEGVCLRNLGHMSSKHNITIKPAYWGQIPQLHQQQWSRRCIYKEVHSIYMRSFLKKHKQRGRIWQLLPHLLRSI